MMRVPTATYRVQLNPGFGFQDLGDQLDYLVQLGISDIYASPIFKARPGSQHGYDIIDPNELNPELGSEAQWQALIDQGRQRDMGWIQDIVPNHMAYSGANPYMAVVLEQGPEGDAGKFFDIRWDHRDPDLHGRVSAPFLGQDLNRCLSRGEIRLVFDAEGLGIVYYDQRLPLALATYGVVFDKTAVWSEADPDPVVADWLRTSERITTASDGDCRGLADIKKKLWHRYVHSSDVRRYVDQRLAVYNSDGPSLRLQNLLSEQYYHLTHWQSAARVINYRRFFSINELIAVRQEDQRTFDRTHSLIQRLVRSGVFTGLRVDHIDGLLSPGDYLHRLRRACGDCYLIVEKILADDEDPPLHWPIQGTSGYDFAAHVDRIFTDTRNASSMTSVYDNFSGHRQDFDATARQSKTLILDQAFSGDLDNLTMDFKALPEFAHLATDHLKSALAQALIALPVYRTYLINRLPRVADSQIITRAIADAAERNPALNDCFDAIRRAMLAIGNGFAGKGLVNAEAGPLLRAVGAFEQLSSALAAKGVEDTAFYRYSRLLALNDVGHSPQCFGESRREFHAFAQKRRRQSPHSLNALSTHDSKRCADVRSRLLVLSELPAQWAEHIAAWREMNRACWPAEASPALPDGEMEYFIYQTLVGTLPMTDGGWAAYVRRIEDYLIKAARENSSHTSWTAPDPAYETGLSAFLHRVLASDGANPFLEDLRRFTSRVAVFGRINALSQTLIQLTAPGVPDIYQGTELFDDSLVDPDNRRPVDFSRRRRVLDELLRALEDLPSRLATGLLAAGDYDKAKLLLIHQGLQLRRRYPELFARGGYLPLKAAGVHEGHLVAFARRRNDQWCVTAVQRFLTHLSTADEVERQGVLWADTRIELAEQAPRRWTNVLTHTRVHTKDLSLMAADLFQAFPAALLMARA